MTENSTEVEETYETDEQGVAYSSESAPSADAPCARRPPPRPRPAAARRPWPASGIVPGTGVWTVNGRTLDSYFPNKLHQQVVNEPFAALQASEGRFDVIARIHGGGITGQAGALRLGVARCLNSIDVEANQPAETAGLLTRDARVIERKKAGLKKARKAPQFSSDELPELRLATLARGGRHSAGPSGTFSAPTGSGAWRTVEPDRRAGPGPRRSRRPRSSRSAAQFEGRRAAGGRRPRHRGSPVQFLRGRGGGRPRVRRASTCSSSACCRPRASPTSPAPWGPTSA